MCSQPQRHVNFEVEITQYEDTDFLFVLRFKKVAGSNQRKSSSRGVLELHLLEDRVFRETTAAIIQGLKL
jgi:hypothetical protein